MRVIGGKAKGSSLVSPNGTDVRPTSDRVREAIFSSIQRYVADAMVLDLFAGAGTMGIEALSRYAKMTYFVDCSKNQIKLIEENLKKTKLLQNAVLICSDVDIFIDTLERRGLLFDLVFMDPPYRKGLVLATLDKLAGAKILTSEAIVVVEFDKREEPPTEVGLLYCTSIKKYGSTGIAYYRRREES